METIEDYQKEILKAKDDQIALLKEFIEYVNSTNKIIERYENQIDAFRALLSEKRK